MMRQIPLFNTRIARKRRDEALEVVERARFMARALGALGALPSGEYTGEDIRRALQNSALEPHHHNAWGALIMRAVKLGIIVHTGKWRSMSDIRSHARRTPVYERP